MARQSLAHWHLPRALDGVLLYEDRGQRNRFQSQERHSHAELELHFIALYGDGSPNSLLATALDEGFGSYPQFHRVFRQLMGYSPHEHGVQGA